MVGHLTGVGAGQEVALVGGVHDEATALSGSTQGADLRVGQDVSHGGADLKQATVLVFVAGVANPLVQPGFNAVELERDHLRPSAKGLAHGGGLHHPHHGVERGLTGREEHVGNSLLAKRRAAVGQVHEEVEGRGGFPVTVDGGPNPGVGSGHEVTRGVFTEACWRVANPTQAVVERHVAVHQRRIVHAVKRVGVGNHPSVTQAPKNDFPFRELVVVRPEEKVVVLSGVAFQNGTAHALFVAG